MKIVKPSFQIIHPDLAIEGRAIIARIEQAARTCYKSGDLGATTSPGDFVRRITQVLHHESVIEHVSVTVRFVCDRGVSHELVRHRLASFSQESTRYCNYAKDRFGGEISVIQPPELEDNMLARDAWRCACAGAESSYLKMQARGVAPQISRAVLPTCLATTIVMTANLREWRHVFKLRTSKAAHPQMRELMVPLLLWFQKCLPEIFDDIEIEV